MGQRLHSRRLPRPSNSGYNPSAKADEDYAFDLYADGLGVLRNNLGLRDPEQLKKAEYALTSARIADAPAFAASQFRTLFCVLGGCIQRDANSPMPPNQSLPPVSFKTAFAAAW